MEESQEVHIVRLQNTGQPTAQTAKVSSSSLPIMSATTLEDSKCMARKISHTFSLFAQAKETYKINPFHNSQLK